MKQFFFSILFLSITTFAAKADQEWRTGIYAEDVWRYFVGTQEPSGQWNTLEFSTSEWATGKGGFGYGDNDDNTVVENTVSLYTRINFNIDNFSENLRSNARFVTGIIN